MQTTIQKLLFSVLDYVVVIYVESSGNIDNNRVIHYIFSLTINYSYKGFYFINLI